MSLKILLFSLIFFTASVRADTVKHYQNGKEVKPSKFIKYIKSLKEDQIDLAKIAFTLSREVDPSVDIEGDLKRVKTLANEVGKIAGNSNNPQVRIDALSKVISKNMGLKYDFSDPTADKFENNLLSFTFRTNKGSCATIPMLYLVVAKQLNWPLVPVMAPNHLFLRYYAPPMAPINIEATSGGGNIIDSWYVKRFNIQPFAIENGTYMRNLSNKEAVAILLRFNSEYYFLKQNHLKAFEYIDTALELFPNNPHLIMEKGYMFQRLSQLSMAQGDLYGSAFMADRAQEIGKKAFQLGYQKLDKTEYLKQMSELEKLESNQKKDSNKLM